MQADNMNFVLIPKPFTPSLCTFWGEQPLEAGEEITDAS